MRIALFGGTFDPPHRAHLAVAQAAADAFSLDTVLLTPTGRQPLKDTAPRASFAHRLAMTNLLCGSDARLQASDLDAPHADGSPNYTIDLLRKFHPLDCTLYVLVGADSFRNLRQWKEPDALLQLAEWIVVTRPGSPLEHWNSFTPQQQSHLHVLDSLHMNVSATRVRDRLHHTATPTGIADLTPEVAAYIQHHHLYKD